jgi:hypothetical protein
MTRDRCIAAHGESWQYLGAMQKRASAVLYGAPPSNDGALITVDDEALITVDDEALNDVGGNPVWLR